MKTPELCLMAVQQDKSAVEYVPFKIAADLITQCKTREQPKKKSPGMGM